jgi:hypothetical protein
MDGGETPRRMPQQQVRDRRSLRVSQKTVDWVLFPHRLLVGPLAESKRFGVS